MKNKLIVLFLHCALLSVPYLAYADAASGSEEVSKKLTDWETRLEYARLLSNLKRFDEALAQYQKLLDQMPDSPIVLSEVAQVLYYQGKKEEALKLLENIPRDKLDDKGLLLKGDIYESLKEYNKAEEIFRNQLVKDPSDDATRLKIAEMLSWQKKYEESVALYRQILSTNPDDIQVRRKYALVLMWMGKEKEAAEELEKTLK